MAEAIVNHIEQFFSDGMPLCVMSIPHHHDTKLHTHNFSELVIVLHGSGVHMSPAGDYPIYAGDVFVLHGDQAHGYRDTAGLGLVNVLFRLDELAIPLLDIVSLPGYHALFTLEPLFRQRDSFESRLRLPPDQLQHISELVQRLVLEYDSHLPGRRFAVVAYFMLMVTDLCRYYSHMEDTAAQPLLRLGRVIGYLQQHFAEHLTLDDLATIGCLSRRSLTREFKKAMNCSPIDYLIRLRINHAMELLRDESLSITEVAFRVGFLDSNYFTRQFRAIAGCRPRDLRKTHRMSG
ncbi:MAG: helix-turn-helix domain-containing protein [Armatimonadota bacterium]